MRYSVFIPISKFMRGSSSCSSLNFNMLVTCIILVWKSVAWRFEVSSTCSLHLHSMRDAIQYRCILLSVNPALRSQTGVPLNDEWKIVQSC